MSLKTSDVLNVNIIAFKVEYFRNQKKSQEYFISKTAFVVR